jgi:hypothetical protein
MLGSFQHEHANTSRNQLQALAMVADKISDVKARGETDRAGTRQIARKSCVAHISIVRKTN